MGGAEESLKRSKKKKSKLSSLQTFSNEAELQVQDCLFLLLNSPCG